MFSKRIAVRRDHVAMHHSDACTRRGFVREVAMKIGKTITKLSIMASAVSGIFLFEVPTPAVAQEAAYMSCDALWYARNEIYARRGYCFQTPRAQATFGPGCFPPYGALSGWERDRVNELQMWERRKGC